MFLATESADNRLAGASSLHLQRWSLRGEEEPRSQLSTWAPTVHPDPGCPPRSQLSTQTSAVHPGSGCLPRPVSKLCRRGQEDGDEKGGPRQQSWDCVPMGGGHMATGLVGWGDPTPSQQLLGARRATTWSALGQLLGEDRRHVPPRVPGWDWQRLGCRASMAEWNVSSPVSSCGTQFGPWEVSTVTPVPAKPRDQSSCRAQLRPPHPHLQASHGHSSKGSATPRAEAQHQSPWPSPGWVGLLPSGRGLSHLHCLLTPVSPLLLLLHCDDHVSTRPTCTLEEAPGPR